MVYSTPTVSIYIYTYTIYVIILIYMYICAVCIWYLYYYRFFFSFSFIFFNGRISAIIYTIYTISEFGKKPGYKKKAGAHYNTHSRAEQRADRAAEQTHREHRAEQLSTFCRHVSTRQQREPELIHSIKVTVSFSKKKRLE